MRLLKQIVNTLLALTLLVATTGVTLNKHYCMGRLKAMAINESANPCTEAGEGAIPLPCCKNVAQELKVSSITIADFDFEAETSLLELATLPSFTLLSSYHTTKIIEDKKWVASDPPSLTHDITVLNRVFLI